jgi:hypothetical protein
LVGHLGEGGTRLQTEQGGPHSKDTCSIIGSIAEGAVQGCAKTMVATQALPIAHGPTPTCSPNPPYGKVLLHPTERVPSGTPQFCWPRLTQQAPTSAAQHGGYHQKTGSQAGTHQ